MIVYLGIASVAIGVMLYPQFMEWGLTPGQIHGGATLTAMGALGIGYIWCRENLEAKTSKK